MSGVPIGQVTKAMRQKGKVAELALGFGGGVEAMKRMGALSMGLTAEELPGIVAQWRRASPRICSLWYDLENTIKRVMQANDAVSWDVARLTVAREFDAELEMDFLTIKLPSGRKLFYIKPYYEISDLTGKPTLVCMGVDQTTRRWSKSYYWYGKWTENVIQAIARDCLAEVLLRAQAAGLQVVLHVHDEVLVDTPNPGDLDKLLELMSKPMPWAPDLLLKGDGYTCSFYRKD